MPKTAPMGRDEARAALERVGAAMHAQHPDNRARLDQLDAHLSTSAMVVDHLFDEADRG